LVIIVKYEVLYIEQQRRDGADMLERALEAFKAFPNPQAPLWIRRGRSKMGRPQLMAIFPTCFTANAAYEWFDKNFDPRP